MSPADVLREGWRNLVAQPTRTFLLLLASAALVGGPIVAETAWLISAVEREARFETDGGYTAYATFETPLTEDRCLRLSDAPYVRAVAGLLELEQSQADRQPQTRFTSFAVTDSGLAALAPGADSGVHDGLRSSRVVVLGPRAAQELGVGVGAKLRINGDMVEVESVLDAAELRVPRLERAIIRRLDAPGVVEECFIVFDPAAFDQGLVAVDALVPEPGSVDRFGPFTGRGAGQLPEAELQGRGHRWVWVGTGLALGLLFGVELWARRSEVALVRSLGSTIANVVALYMVERLLIIWFGLVVGASAGIVVAATGIDAISPEQAAFAVRPGLLAAAITAWLTLLLLTSTAGHLGAQTLKDR